MSRSPWKESNLSRVAMLFDSDSKAGIYLHLGDKGINGMSVSKSLHHKLPNELQQQYINADLVDVVMYVFNAEIDRQFELLTALFGMYTGLRPSELLAIAYGDIDFDTWELRVQRGIVQGAFSYTKNTSSERTIELLDNAIEVLKKVLKLRGDIPAKPVTIVDEDNRTERKEDLKLLFVSSRSGNHWSGSESFGKMFFKPHCEASSVRYRAIGQARHTYGSHMMTLNLSLKWIAGQMGHSSITMLEKHYGKLMRAKGREMASQVSEKWKQCFVENRRA